MGFRVQDLGFRVRVLKLEQGKTVQCLSSRLKVNVGLLGYLMPRYICRKQTQVNKPSIEGMCNRTLQLQNPIPNLSPQPKSPIPYITPLNPNPETLNPKPLTLNPKPLTLNPKPQTRCRLMHKAAVHFHAMRFGCGSPGVSQVFSLLDLGIYGSRGGGGGGGGFRV